MNGPDRPDPDDDALVASFLAGEATAFDALVTRYRRQIYNVCHGILHDHAQADEACQEAFLKAWHGLPRFKGESSFRTWLYRIGMNAAHDMRARESARARTRAEAARELPRTGARPRALDDLVQEQELQRLQDAIARLPERQRLTLTLKVQELKYTEIAEVLGSPVGTVKANFHHAVQNLRRMLAPEGASAGAALTAGEEA